MNERTENIGARRLHTVMEKLLDEVSFEASELGDVRRDAVDRDVGRLARQAIGTMASLRPFQSSAEELVADGFESFVRSQYCPNNIHHLIGSESQYVHACDLAHMRRKGRMTGRQKRKRERLEKTDAGVSGEIGASFERSSHT